MSESINYNDNELNTVSVDNDMCASSRDMFINKLTDFLDTKGGIQMKVCCILN